MKAKMLLGWLLIVLLVVSACAPTPTGSEPGPTPTETPTTGSEPTPDPAEPTNEAIGEVITIARRQDSNDLDPITQDGNVNIWVFNLVLEGLVKTSDDGTAVEPALAESWEISEDGTVYTFHLQKDLKFSDGSPVTSEDWLWSLNRSLVEDSVWSFGADGIVNIESPDPETVIITTDQARPSTLAQLAMFSMVLQDKSYYDEVGQEKYSQGPRGTGPYVFKEWKMGEYILLERNPNYRVEGLPKTDQIKFVAIPDDSTRSLQVESGQIDIAVDVPYNLMSELEKNPDLKVMGIPSTEISFFIFNNKFEPFEDVRVRQAMRYGIDQQAIVDFVLKGFGEPALSYAPPTGMYWNGDIKPAGYDPEKAKALLAEAGYPDGFDLELLIRSGNSTHEQNAVIIKEQLSKIGVNVEIVAMEAATAVAKYRAFEYEATFAGWTNDLSDPVQQAEYVFVPEVTAAYNTQWTHPDVVELVNQAKKEMDPEKRKELYYELQQIHYDEVPMIPLFYASFPVAMSSKIDGFVQTPLGNYRFENLIKNK